MEAKTVSVIKKLREAELAMVAEFAEFLENRSSASEVMLNQLASEKALAKDWLTKEEDKAWAHL